MSEENAIPSDDRLGDPPTQEEWDAVGRELDEKEWPDLYPVGSVSRCPECGAEAFEGRDGLDLEVTYKGVVHYFHDLKGVRCRACGAQSLDMPEMFRVEKRLGMDPNHFPPQVDFEAKVAQFGSGSLGTYWPKDIRRIMNLKPGQRAHICVVDKNAVLVRFE